ncbi:GNAT family N-acetyltransferase [Flavihumibacter profundi]|uniref:GNAT family N-acetyltransferase n=1 Tax=Flavihumibacter profundi TaxID=2716883 RepID=UPI001CC46706|nr:GNAT family protein [Flavihumibacter profundi]MBZ5857507.1 GNAT family N-acetyltransferase [Flavihumibacter profundi]
MHPAINPYLLYDPMPLPDFAPIFSDLLDKSVLYKFIVEGRAAGMCKLVHQYFRNAHTIYLGGVAIHPDFTGKGYGLQMLQEIIAYAVGKGCRRIELSTGITNEKAIRLYERVGFVKEGVLRNYTWFKNEDRFLDEIMMSWIN